MSGARVAGACRRRSLGLMTGKQVMRQQNQASTVKAWPKSGYALILVQMEQRS
jgi:hypothetical protein